METSNGCINTYTNRHTHTNASTHTHTYTHTSDLIFHVPNLCLSDGDCSLPSSLSGCWLIDLPLISSRLLPHTRWVTASFVSIGGIPCYVAPQSCIRSRRPNGIKASLMLGPQKHTRIHRHTHTNPNTHTNTHK